MYYFFSCTFKKIKVYVAGGPYLNDPMLMLSQYEIIVQYDVNLLSKT